MSLKTLITHIWEAISSVFHHAEAEVKGVLLPTVTFAVSALKTIADIDQADMIGHLAGRAGPLIEDKIREALPKILTELRLVSAVVNAGTPEQIIAAAMAELHLSSDRAKDAFYHSIAAMLLVDLADGKLSWSEAVELVEFYYMNKPA
jgi:aspartokinase-like uncharacterized kinase